MSNQIRKAKEETLNVVQRVVELLADPENQRRVFAMLADMEGEKEAKGVEKEKAVIVPVTVDKAEDENECEGNCIGCKVNEFLEDYPGYAPYFDELHERYRNDEIDEEVYVDMLHDYLLMAASEVTRIKYKPEDLPGFINKQPRLSTSATIKPKPRERNDLERSVPWGRNNPSSLTSHIATEAEKVEESSEKLNDEKDVLVRHHDWLNLQLELIRLRASAKAIYEYSKELEKQLELESGVKLEPFKFSV